MSTQQNPATYAKAIQAQLDAIFTTTPVYANFNRNFARETQFVTWNLRNVHQEVYTGNIQANKGIDRPIFQVSIFAQDMQIAFDLSNVLLQALHGYSGQFGGVTGFYLTKADVNWLYNTYDNEIGLNQIILDVTLDIAT